MNYLETPHVVKFLDALDEVLNSNTFLLSLKSDFHNISNMHRLFRVFLDSGSFKGQILESYALRQWNNYQQDKKGEIVRPGYELEFTELPADGVHSYFSSMLTVESNPHNFWSPYDKQFSPEKSAALVTNFLSEIAFGHEIKVFLLNTDFSYSQIEVSGKKQRMAYFEGDYASDSATLIIRSDDKAYLLLTNGLA